MRKTINAQPEQTNPAKGQKQHSHTIPMDAYNEANLRLCCVTAILAIIEADAYQGNDLGMSSDVIGEALHGVGLLIKDAKNLLSGGVK